jgi:hypothetical protein
MPKTRRGRRNTRRSTRRMRGGQDMPPAEMKMDAPGPSAAQMGGKMPAVGTRAEVMHGTAHHTSGGLTKSHLKYNKHGRIVSRKASERGKKSLKHLIKAGYKAKKGTFRLFKKSRK